MISSVIALTPAPSSTWVLAKEVTDLAVQCAAKPAQRFQRGVLAGALQAVQGRLADAEPFRHFDLSKAGVPADTSERFRELTCEVHEGPASRTPLCSCE